jgi:hypothetical protein
MKLLTMVVAASALAVRALSPDEYLDAHPVVAVNPALDSADFGMTTHASTTLTNKSKDTKGSASTEYPGECASSLTAKPVGYPKPTASPTNKPTYKTTDQPAMAPTEVCTSEKHTPEPAENPTFQHQYKPTHKTAFKPTNEPTAAPTEVCTTEKHPTKPTSTENRIHHPTKKPTYKPPNKPSYQTTDCPTDEAPIMFKRYLRGTSAGSAR